MIVSEFVPAVWLKSSGEVFDGVSGDEDWNKVLAIANRYIDTWMAEPGVDWESTYALTNIGSVSSTDTYDLDDSIYRVSNDAGDPVRINHSDGQGYTDYNLVAANQMKRYRGGNYCSRIGKSIKFARPFTATDPQYGGTVEIPGYVKPDYLVKDNDEIAIDDFNWLILTTAAELTRPDLTQAQNYSLLIAEANNAMAGMKAANAPSVIDIMKHPVARATEW